MGAFPHSGKCLYLSVNAAEGDRTPKAISRQWTPTPTVFTNFAIAAREVRRRRVLNRTRSLTRPRLWATTGAPLVTVFARPVFAPDIRFVNLNDPGQLR
jgi:hypothetical protein